MNSLLSADPDVEVRPQLAWMVHVNRRVAVRQARLLEAMTGDFCYVMWRGSLYFVVRYDPSGKEVAQM